MTFPRQNTLTPCSLHAALPDASALVSEAFIPVPSPIQRGGFYVRPPPGSALNSARTPAATPQGAGMPSPPPRTASASSDPFLTSPAGLSRGLEAAAQLLAELHHASREDQLLAEEAPQPDPDVSNPQFAQVRKRGCLALRGAAAGAAVPGKHLWKCRCPWMTQPARKHYIIMESERRRTWQPKC